MHKQVVRVALESPLRSLIEMQTEIIGTLGYMKSNLQKRCSTC